MSINEIRRLNSEKWKIEKKIAKAIKNTFPKGKLITFERGKAWIHAEITNHAEDRVEIKNLNTDKKYWIEAYWLIR